MQMPAYPLCLRCRGPILPGQETEMHPLVPRWGWSTLGHKDCEPAPPPEYTLTVTSISEDAFTLSDGGRRKAVPVADHLTPARASEIRRRLDEYAVALNNVSGNGEAWGAPDEAAVRAFTQHAAADLRALLDFYEAAVPLLHKLAEIDDHTFAGCDGLSMSLWESLCGLIGASASSGNAELRWRERRMLNRATRHAVRVTLAQR